MNPKRYAMRCIGQGCAQERARRGAVGVFLLLLLVAVAIVLVLVFMPGGSAETALDAKESAEESVALFSGAAVATDVRGYIALNGEAPASLEELEEYRGGRYVDPWGTAMRVEFNADARGRVTTVTVLSAGADEEWGTDDDQRSEHPVGF